MVGQKIAIDLGTKTLVVYVKRKGIIINEPTSITIDKKRQTTLAVGFESEKMNGKTPQEFITIHPIEKGVVSNYTITEKLLKTYIGKISNARIFSPKIMVSIPAQITEVERKAIIDVINNVGPRKMFLIKSPIASALGNEIDIFKAEGNAVVDIGDGITDICVISLGGSVISKSIHIAGSTIDKIIVRYVKKTHNLIITEKKAEEIKKSIATLKKAYVNETMEIRGREILTGLPKKVLLNSEEIQNAILPKMEELAEEIQNVLSETPPDILTDIVNNGVLLTGGMSLLSGIDEFLSEKVEIKFNLAKEPLIGVALGMNKAYESIEYLENVLEEKYNVVE